MTRHKDCRRYEDLLLQEAERPLTPEERAFMARHQSTCPECRMEHRALSLLRLSESHQRVWPIDDVTRHRQIESVLDALERETDVGSSSATTASQRRRRPAPRRSRIPMAWLAVAAGLAAAAIGILVALWSRPGSREPAPPRKSAPRVAARLLLVAGEVRTGPRSLHGASLLRTSDTVVVGRGRAAFQLPDASRVFLGEETEATLVRVRGSTVLIRLHRGSLFARVTPRHEGSFVVEAGVHRVVVVGTAFGVERTGSQLTVAVLKGRVRVEGPRVEAVVLNPGQTAWIAGEGPVRVRRDDGIERWRRIRRLLLALAVPTREPASRLEVTAPDESLVSLDGLPLGPAPVEAFVPVGRKRLQIVRDRRVVMVEEVRLAAGQRLTRHLSQLVGPTQPRPLTDAGSPGPGAHVTAAEGSSPPGHSGQTASAGTPPEPSHGAMPPDLPVPHHRKSLSRTPRAAATLQSPDGARGPTADHGRPTSGSEHTAPEAPAPWPNGTPDSPAPPRPVPPRISEPQPPSPAELLRRARRLRAARAYGKAAALYEQLIEQYPASSESRVALVALGLLEVGPLHRPRAALRHLSRYLRVAPRGPVALEALFGRARALRALGRRKEERRVLEEIVRRYPNTPQARAARERLERLRAGKPRARTP